MSFWFGSKLKLMKKEFYHGWIVLAILFVIGVVISGMHYSFGVFLKFLQEDFGWGRASTSGVYSAYVVLSAVFAIFAGWALDRYSARAVFTTMGLFTALSLLLTSQVGSPWQLYLTYSLLLAIGNGGRYVVSMATANRWFTRRRGLVLGVVGSGFNVSMMVMGPFSAYLISGYGWRSSFLIIGLITFFIIIPCSQLLRRSPSEIASLPQGNGLEATDYESPLGQSCSRTEGLSLSQAMGTRNLWLLSLTMFLFSYCVYAVIIHLVPHATDLGIPTIQAASLLTFIGGGGIAGRLLLGRVSDNIGRKRAYMICPLLMAGAMLWLIESSDLWMLYLFAIVFGFAFGGFSSTGAAIFGDTFGLRHLGVIMGFAEIGWQLGAAIGSISAGYIFDISDSYVFAFIAGIITSLITAILILFLREPKSSTL